MADQNTYRHTLKCLLAFIPKL